MKGLAVSFAETLNMSEKDSYGKKHVVSKDQFVRINFDQSAEGKTTTMKPISKFKLNQNCSYVRHNVFEPSNSEREYYVIQNRLEE